MMKMIVIGILYHLLLQSNAAAEPMVKIQLCDNVFSYGITGSLNQIGSSELKEEIGNFELKKLKSLWPLRWKTTVIPITSAQIKCLKRSEILSSDSCETLFDVTIEYGDKSHNQNRKKTSNSYLFLRVGLIVTFNFKMDGGKITFKRDKCEFFLREAEDESKKVTPDTKAMNTLAKNLCDFTNKTINTMNENRKDLFIIEPSGDAKLLFKSANKTSPECVEFNFNMNVSNSEVSSEQRHEALPGNGMSIAKDCFPFMFSAEEFKKELDKLEQTYLSPEDLRRILTDVFETDKTTVKCKVEELNINAENKTMTLMMTLEGFSPKSDKCSFQVKLRAAVEGEFKLNNNRVTFQFKSSGVPTVLSWKSYIGKSGEPDYKNLHTFTEQFTNGTLVPALNKLQEGLGISFWFWNLPSELSVKPESVQIEM